MGCSNVAINSRIHCDYTTAVYNYHIAERNVAPSIGLTRLQDFTVFMNCFKKIQFASAYPSEQVMFERKILERFLQRSIVNLVLPTFQTVYLLKPCAPRSYDCWFQFPKQLTFFSYQAFSQGYLLSRMPFSPHVREVLSTLYESAQNQSPLSFPRSF